MLIGLRRASAGVPGEFMLKSITRVLIVLALVLVAIRVADWTVRRTSKLPAVAHPNGYARIVELAGQLKRPTADMAEMKSAEVLALGKANAPLLRELHTLLDGPVQVPLATESAWVNRHHDDLKSLKRLALILGIQARSHLLESRTNEAIECEIDMIRLGQGISRGGVLVDGLTGLTIELVGGAALRAQAANLGGGACGKAAQAIEACEVRREPAAQVLATETAWSRASFGLVSQLGGLLASRGSAERFKDFRSRHEDTVRRTRRLALLLAVRAWEQETGRPVAKPAEVVPGILKAVPVDPGTGRPMPDVPRLET